MNNCIIYFWIEWILFFTTILLWYKISLFSNIVVVYPRLNNTKDNILSYPCDKEDHMPLQELVSFEAAKSGRKRQKTAGTEHLRRFFGRRLMACCKPLRRLFSSQNRRKLVANFCGGFFSVGSELWLDVVQDFSGSQKPPEPSTLI
jgi:hypothetical protein